MVLDRRIGFVTQPHHFCGITFELAIAMSHEALAHSAKLQFWARGFNLALEILSDYVTNLFTHLPAVTLIVW